MGEDTGQEDLRAPDGSEPSVPREPYARRKAAELLSLAAHPSLVPAGAGFVTEDSAKAAREAQIGIGWALVYLADALGGNPPEPEPEEDYDVLDSVY